MGEYADDYFRREVKRKFGFDPYDGISVVSVERQEKKMVPCKVCGKFVKKNGLKDHMRDVHKEHK